MSDPAPPDGLLAFLRTAGRLKETVRAGWTLRGVPAPESVADHTFGVALLALVLAPRAEASLDRERCLSLALAHDLAESLVGDITPYDGVSGDEKRARERAAAAELSALAGDGGEILRLWEEYDAARTPEARFVKELDKLETLLQAAAYEAREGYPPEHLQEFWDGCTARLTTPALRALAAQLAAARPSRPEDGESASQPGE